MNAKPWGPENASSAWAVMVPQRVLDNQGLTYGTYQGLLVDKLEGLIEHRDPAEDDLLYQFPFWDNPETSREAALAILAAVENPAWPNMEPIRSLPENEDLAAYLEEEQLSDALPDILAAR